MKAMRVLGVVLVGAGLIGGAVAQTVQRRAYTMSDGMKHDLEARQFDPAQVERIVNSVAEGLADGDLKPILDNTGPTLRVTAGKTNTVIRKEHLADFKAQLTRDPALKRDVADEDQFILKGDEVGLARGTVWIDAQCVDTACSKKKSTIVTINLP